jgi:hypothetical protein
MSSTTTAELPPTGCGGLLDKLRKFSLSKPAASEIGGALSLDTTTLPPTSTANNESDSGHTNDVTMPSPPPAYSQLTPVLSPQDKKAGADTKSPKTPISPEWMDTPSTPTAPAAAAAVAEADALTEAKILDQAVEAFGPPPKGTELPPLPKPVLVPRVNPRQGLPYARCWAPELEKHAIKKEDFVSFVDTLNIMVAPHAAFNTLHLAALGVGFVPWEGAEGVAAGIELIAVGGTIAVAHKRTKQYLQRMNDTYFHPRDLHVKLTNTKKMMKLLELDPKKDPLIAPLTEETLKESVQERCLRHLSQWTCELSFEDIPEPKKPTGVFSTMAQWDIDSRLRSAERRAQRGRKSAWKKHMKGKKLKEDRGERTRVKQLGWILIQNRDEWETIRAAKEAKKAEKAEKRRAWTRSSIVA